MKQFFTTKRLCRAGIIAALYVVLTWVFMAVAYNGFLQIRPAEALCILPLFFPEAVPALFIGCVIANSTSPFALYDMLIGGMATLLASTCTYLVGRAIRKDAVRLAVGGIFPILFNAIFIPFIIVVLCGDLGGYEAPLVAYLVSAASIAATEAVWVYALGAPLYVTVKRLQRLPYFQ